MRTNTINLLAVGVFIALFMHFPLNGHYDLPAGIVLTEESDRLVKCSAELGCRAGVQRIRDEGRRSQRRSADGCGLPSGHYSTTFRLP